MQHLIRWSLLAILTLVQLADAEDLSDAKRAEWFRHQRQYPGTSIPQDVVRLAIESFDRQTPKSATKQAAATAASQWTSIGPQPIGVNTPAVYGGQVNDIVIDPRNNNTVYAGVDGGGVWKSLDGGTNWKPLTDDQPAMSIQSLALDPANPDTIYAGTGSSYYGAGILKSINGGTAWSQITGPFVNANGGLDVTSIGVMPGNSQVLLVAAGGSLYRTVDGCQTWTVIWQVGGFGRTANGSVYKAVFDPLDGSHVYASVDGSGMMQSLDGGATFVFITGSTANRLVVPQGAQISFAIAPSQPSTIYVAWIGDYQVLSFYKSTNYGADWKQIQGLPGDPYIATRWALSVHPTKPDTVFAGKWYLYLSVNGGQDWNTTNSYTGAPYVGQHAQTFSKDGARLYIGSNGGAWSSPASNITSFFDLTWTNLNNTLATTLCNPGFALLPTDINTALVGTAGNSLVRYRGTAAWDLSDTISSAYAAIDFSQPSNMYHSAPGIDIWKSTKSGAASSWTRALTGIEKNDFSAIYAPLVMSPTNSQTLYFGTSRLYQTTDGAASWTAVSGTLTGSGIDPVLTIGVANDGNTVYTGSCARSIYVTRNVGATATWTNIAAGLPIRCATQITVDPTDPKIAYITFSGFAGTTPTAKGHIYKTTTAGSSWTDLSGNLPDIPVNDVVIDPDIANTLYAATDIGVYRSSDSGVSWLPLGTGLPHAVVTGIKLHRLSRTLRATTYGRGVWDLAVLPVGQVRVTITSSTPGAPFSLGDGAVYQAPITFPWATGSTHTVTWLPTTTLLAGARYQFQTWTDSSGANPRTITVGASDASYTANVRTQYLLTVSIVPENSGTVYLNPSSGDGYYDAGTRVQVTAAPAAGYFYQGINGNAGFIADIVNQPDSLMANFVCYVQSGDTFTNPVGPGQSTGILTLTAGVGCPWTIQNQANFITLNGPSSGIGNGSVPYSIAANTSASNRTGTLGLSNGAYGNIVITQDAASSVRPTLVSLSPSSGTGLSQVFSLQLADVNGFQSLNEADVSFFSGSGPCFARFVKTGTQWTAAINNDAYFFTYQPAINVPGTGVQSNKQCQFNAAQFSATGSGNILTLTFGFTFSPSFAGQKAIQVSAVANNNPLSLQQTLGLWTVSASGCTYSLSSTSTAIGWQAQPGSLRITASDPACYWNAISDSAWLKTTAASDGIGSATIRFSATANPNTTQRVATLTIAGQTFTVTQAAQTPGVGLTLRPRGDFTQGLQAFYLIDVSSAQATPAITGPVTVTETLPAGLTLVSMAGTGWTCNASSCTRTDGLTAGITLPTILVTVTAALDAPLSLTNTASVTAEAYSASASSTTAITTAANGIPRVLSLSPPASSGTSQTFTMQFQHPAGYANLAVLNMLVNTALDGRQACYIAYVPQSNALFLVDDAGDAGGPYTGMLLSGSGSIANSQCTISGAGSSAAGSGTTFTLTLKISFTNSNAKVVYLSARDSAQNGSGWLTMGVTGNPSAVGSVPQPVSVSPASGSGASAVFSFTYTIPFGSGTTWALINTARDGVGSCYVAYYAPGNLLFLYPDDGNGYQSPQMELKGTNSLSNSQCTVSSQGSSVTTNGIQITMNLNITFKPSFGGTKGVWMAVQASGTSDWQPLGAWLIP